MMILIFYLFYLMSEDEAIDGHLGNDILAMSDSSSLTVIT
jgi:hypothetical protein